MMNAFFVSQQHMMINTYIFRVVLTGHHPRHVIDNQIVDAVWIVVGQQIQRGPCVAHIDVTVSATAQIEDQREFVVVVLPD